MSKTIIIGTLHAGITINQELEKILVDCQPNQLLVEIAQADINNNNIDKYPPEMIFAYHWALKNKIKVKGFDSEIDTWKPGLTEADNQATIDKQKEIIKNYRWQDFNKQEIEDLIKSINTISDPAKEQERNKEILVNINKALADEPGTTVILTGCGHLEFFEKNIPNAIFPLR